MEERFFDNLLFEGISRETLQDLDIPIEERRLDDGEILFEEGDPGDDLYLVLQGEIRISKKGRGGKQETLASESAGSFLGHMALLDGRSRSARATATKPSTLGRIDREGFERLLSHSSETARHFARLITDHLRSAHTRFIDELIEIERLSLLGTMMSAMVHDFRNPVATLVMVSEYLASQEDDPTLIKLGECAEEAIEHMQSMIQELLDYSRGTVRLEFNTITIPELVATLDRQVLNKMEESGIAIRRELEYKGELTCDKNRLIRLLLNIVKNSREAMTEKGSLTLRIRRAVDDVEFEIEDTGCGIDEEMLKRVFEPFVTHGKSLGTGLGLSIVKSVVEAHQGAIRMESVEGKGTTSHITLPICPLEAAASP